MKRRQILIIAPVLGAGKTSQHLDEIFEDGGDWLGVEYCHNLDNLVTHAVSCAWMWTNEADLLKAHANLDDCCTIVDLTADPTPPRKILKTMGLIPFESPEDEEE